MKFPNNLIRRMDLIVTDDLAAAKADSGDLVEACQTRIARWEDILRWKRSSPMACRNRGPKEYFSNPTASPTKTSLSAAMYWNKRKRKNSS